MPEFYPSIGDAVGAAMHHNIRLAHGGKASGSDTPPQVRYLPSPSADPYSIPGMIARLTETATPDEVAGIIEEINGALVGALPQLTELVAAAADWARVRLDFDDTHHNPAFETWTRLAAAHGMLRDAQEQLEIAEDGIAACPAELSEPRHHEMVNVLRTREPTSGTSIPRPWPGCTRSGSRGSSSRTPRPACPAPRRGTATTSTRPWSTCVLLTGRSPRAPPARPGRLTACWPPRRPSSGDWPRDQRTRLPPQ